MHKYLMAFVVAMALAGLGLAGCHKSTPEQSPGEQMQQGAQQMGQGIKNAATRAGAYASDAAITSHVKARLAANQGLSSFSISVETSNGIVTLTGTVDNQAQRKLAGQLTANTEGVKGVNNEIEVTGKGG